jgi:hypothetical protein
MKLKAFFCLNVHLYRAQGSVHRHAAISLSVWMLKVMGVTFRTDSFVLYTQLGFKRHGTQ